jgi:hypothetical protein
MSTYCSALDGQLMSGFLETDKAENVAFHRRFGFEVVREVEVIGITTFFMARCGHAAKV